MRLVGRTRGVRSCREQLAWVAVYRDIELCRWEWDAFGIGVQECILGQYRSEGMWRDRKTYCSHLFSG